MIVLDVNILIYAYDPRAEKHDKARGWIEKLFTEGTTPVGIPWQTAHAFLRIVTNPRVSGGRVTTQEAVAVVDSWLARPNVRFLAPGDHHWSALRRMLIDGQANGPLVSDAQLAALTIEHGGELYTTDRDFARFPGLRWNNPLAGS